MKPSPSFSYIDSFFSSSSLSLPTSQTDIITVAHEPDDTTGNPNRHQRCSSRLPSPTPHSLSLCAQDRRNNPRKIDPSLAQLANNHPADQSPVPGTESTSVTENSAEPPSPTTPTPTTTTVGTTRGTTTTTSIETPPPSPTEEDREIFDNLVDLLFKLILTVYLYHRHREHWLRR